MNQAAKDTLIRARAGLILDHPFLGSLALRLPLVEKEDIPTLATDGRVMYYNPTFINSIPVAQVKAECAHEVMHCVLDHMGRRGAKDPTKWNHACDHAINPDLKDLGFQLGDDWLLDVAFKGMSADHIYSLIPDPPPGSGKRDDIMDGKADPLTPLEKREWKIATVQAANAAKAMGKLPAGLEKFMDELTKPQVDWKAILRRFVTQRDDADYSWARPNRRMLAHDLYLPSLYSEKMGKLGVFKDISGSIDAPISNAFGGEIKALVEDLRPEETHVLYVNAEVAKYDMFLPDDFQKLDSIGGGGTDFRPPFIYLKQRHIEPVCAIYLTDLEGTFPAEPPPYPVLWCTINDHVAPWGETVKIEI
jgi:Uncharacterized protein conserved in bacteria